MIQRYSIELRSDAAGLVQRLGNREGLGQAIARGMDLENEETLKIIRRKLSGEVLHRRTGRLRNSMQRTEAVVGTQGTGVVVTAVIGSNVGLKGGNSVVYAHIHEVGGVIRRVQLAGSVRLRTDRDGNLIRNARHGAVFAKPSHKRALTVPFAGGKRFEIRIPARPYLGPSVADSLVRLKERVSGNVVEFYGGKG